MQNALNHLQASVSFQYIWTGILTVTVTAFVGFSFELKRK